MSPGGTRFAWSPDGEELIYTGTGAGSTVLWFRRCSTSRKELVRGVFALYMHDVEGETLRSKLDRERQLGIEEALRIAREVADARTTPTGTG